MNPTSRNMIKNPNHTRGDKKQMNGMMVRHQAHGNSVGKRAAAGQDLGKKNNGKTTGFNAVANKAAAEYGSKAAGERVAGAMFQKMKRAGRL
jgi:hypothetical protein